MVLRLFLQKLLRFTEKSRDRRGSYTLEASLCISVFVLAFCAVLCLSKAADAQKTVQLALNRTACEISGYCYPAAAVSDKIRELTATESEDGDGAVLDEFIDGAFSLLRGNAESASLSEITENLLESGIDGLKESGDISAAVNAALSQYGENPGEICSVMAVLLLNDEAGELLGHLAAAPLCRCLMPKYISEDGASDRLEQLGIKDGIDGIDFSMSTVLPDGSGIRLCAAYHISFFSIGSFSPGYDTVSVAYTGSWCEAAETEESESIWSLGNFSRGQKITAAIKAEYPSQALKSGQGVDLYDYADGEFSLIVSLNVFARTYSSYTGEGTDAGEYTLKDNRIYKELKEQTSALVKAAEKCLKAGTVYGSAGIRRSLNPLCTSYKLVVVVPAEAEEFEEVLGQLAVKLYEKTGVSVDYIYKGNYF